MRSDVLCNRLCKIILSTFYIICSRLFVELICFPHYAFCLKAQAILSDVDDSTILVMLIITQEKIFIDFIFNNFENILYFLSQCLIINS